MRYAVLRRKSSSSSYATQMRCARESAAGALKQFDKSSYVLSAYVPSPAKDCFLGIRSFVLEISKITGGDGTGVNKRLKESIGVSSTDLKVKFWEDLIHKVFRDPHADQVVGEPAGLLLRDALRNDLRLDILSFDQMLTTLQDFVSRHGFRNVDELCSYGEGFYSQSNYLVQDLLLSDQLSPSTVTLVQESPEISRLSREICAHIGQATGVASIVLGTQYYARHHNKVYLPLDLMNEHSLSHEDLLRLFQGHDVDKEAVSKKLQDVVYDTLVTSNDHLITARSKLKELTPLIQKFVHTTTDPVVIQRSKHWRHGIPDCLFVGFMNAIPVDGYLKLLEKHNFNVVVDQQIENAYWKLVYKTYMSYQRRYI